MNQTDNYYYVAVYSKGPNWTGHQTDWPSRLANHIKYQKSLFDRGLLLMGGPFLNRDCGMAILIADNMADARPHVAQDPVVIAGSYTVDVWHWEIALGKV